MIRPAMARRIACSGDPAAQRWPAWRAPEASPTRNALSVTANAVALDPDAYETVRKKKISKDRETKPPAAASANSGRTAIPGMAEAADVSTSAGVGAKPSRSRQWATSAPTATAALIATATEMELRIPKKGNSSTAHSRQAAPAPSVLT